MDEQEVAALAAQAVALALRVAALEAELTAQWERNHYEHCGKAFEDGTLRHEGACYWEMPALLKED